MARNAYEHGIEYFKAGRPITDNRYRQECVEHTQFNRGWNDAKAADDEQASNIPAAALNLNPVVHEEDDPDANPDADLDG